MPFNHKSHDHIFVLVLFLVPIASQLLYPFLTIDQCYVCGRESDFCSGCGAVCFRRVLCQWNSVTCSRELVIELFLLLL